MITLEIMYSFIFRLGKALLPRQDLVSFHHVKVREIEPLFTADVLYKITLAADWLLSMSEFLVFRFGKCRWRGDGSL